MDLELKNITDELVFEDCRHPYILQVTKEYLLLRLVQFILTISVVAASLIIWYKRRSLPRLSVRSLSGLALFLVFFIGESIVGALTEAFNDRETFLNTCVFQQFSFHFCSTIFFISMVLLLFQYYAKYKLYTTIVTKSEISKTSTANDSLRHVVQEKALKFYYFTTEKFAFKVFVAGILISAVVGSFVAFLFCPQLNSNNLCPHKRNVYIDIILYSVVALFVILFLLPVGYATFYYPDPFGIVREVLVVTSAYILQIILYFSLEAVFEPSAGKEYYATPFFSISLIAAFQFCYSVPLQIYLSAAEKKKVTMPFKDILSSTDALKMFILYSEQQVNDENIKFYLAANIFKKRALAGNKDNRKARDLFEEYIVEGAPKQLNLSYTNRCEIENHFQDENADIPTDVFDSAIGTAYQLMVLDTYVRFLNSNLYKIYMGLKMSDENHNLSSRSLGI